MRALATAARRRLHRVNYAGRTVTLAEGVLVVAGAGALTARAGRPVDTVAIVGIGLLGLADDLLEPYQHRTGGDAPKGLRGHLDALRSGRITTGAAKALGIPVLCLAATAAAPGPRGPAARILADAALVAGSANLANLLDLRPGRALKLLLPAAAGLASVPARDPRTLSGQDLSRAALAPALLALPADLRERGMLGDAGANILGAAVGAAATRSAPPPVRGGLLAAVTALTLLSERISFSAVIETTPWLRSLDRVGRRRPPEEDR